MQGAEEMSSFRARFGNLTVAQVKEMNEVHRNWNEYQIRLRKILSFSDFMYAKNKLEPQIERTFNNERSK